MIDRELVSLRQRQQIDRSLEVILGALVKLSLVELETNPQQYEAVIALLQHRFNQFD